MITTHKIVNENDIYSKIVTKYAEFLNEKYPNLQYNIVCVYWWEYIMTIAITCHYKIMFHFCKDHIYVRQWDDTGSASLDITTSAPLAEFSYNDDINIIADYIGSLLT